MIMAFSAHGCGTKCCRALPPRQMQCFSRQPHYGTRVPADSRKILHTEPFPGSRTATCALGGGDDKKFITREEEPEQFWQTPTERKGKNPAQDPLAIIGILGLLIPFIILGIAIATGIVDVNAGKP